MAARILRLSFPVQQEPVVTECLKADPAVGQFYVFRHGTMVNALSPDPPESQEICRIEFQVEGKRVSHAIKSLRQIGLGASFGDIDVAPISCSTQTLPHTRRSERCCRSFAARMPTLEIHAAIVGGSHLTAEHVLLIVLASIMAACGLLTDNLVLILASFFISPLMSMIIAATWGLVVGDGRLCVRGLRNTLLGMLLCLASGERAPHGPEPPSANPDAPEALWARRHVHRAAALGPTRRCRPRGLLLLQPVSRRALQDLGCVPLARVGRA